jgi:hypothetical protein
MSFSPIRAIPPATCAKNVQLPVLTMWYVKRTRSGVSLGGKILHFAVCI